jgi:K+-sensing histidine kinase KdpD
MLLSGNLISNTVARELIQAIKIASVLLNAQVNDLLDKSLILKGEFIEHIQHVNIQEVVLEVVSVL